MSDLCFFVLGVPRAKQSFKVKDSKSGKVGGYTPAIVKAWQNDVAWVAKASYYGEPLKGDLKVTLLFIRPTRHIIDPDNLSKAALDAMQGIIFKDDSQVHDLRIFKAYNKEQPGLLVVIEVFDPGEIDYLLNRLESLDVDTIEPGELEGLNDHNM